MVVAGLPMHACCAFAGTDGQRILILSCRRTDGETGNVLVVDSHMRVKFAACGVAQLLGYPMRKLATMRLDQLLPPPFNTLHAKWIKVGMGCGALALRLVPCPHNPLHARPVYGLSVVKPQILCNYMVSSPCILVPHRIPRQPWQPPAVGRA